jgi:hypothetical protein
MGSPAAREPPQGSQIREILDIQMKHAILLCLAGLLASVGTAGQAGGVARQRPAPAAQAQARPAAEDLGYTLNWPSGLSLGEARLHSSEAEGKRKSSLSLDASLPGFPISDFYTSVSEGEFCSTEFTKKFTHGSRTSEEKTTFDHEQRTASRQTLNPAGGGKSDFATSACPRDALTFLAFLRRELAQGRLPQTEKIYFGAVYEISLKFAGVEKLRVGGEFIDTDRLSATATGPASRTEFQMYFARDAARTPVRVDVPFTLGTFSMELAR